MGKIEAGNSMILEATSDGHSVLQSPKAASAGDSSDF